MSRKLTLLALVVCAAVTGFVLWGLRDDAASRKTHREGVAEPDRERERRAPEPEAEGRPEQPKNTEAEAAPSKPDPAPEPDPARAGEKGGLLVKIVDATGRPVVGTTVKLIGPDEDGKWSTLKSRDLPTDAEVAFDGLRPGRISLSVSRGDFTRSRSVTIPAARRLEVTVPFPEGARVTGVVRHRERGPLPGLALEAKTTDGEFRDTLRATTDPQGRYRMRNVPPGRYPLKITGSAAGFEQHPRAVLEVPDTGRLERDIVLGTVALRGIVRDSASGVPIAGVRVQIQDPYYADCASADDGTYVFHDLAPGTLRLVLTRDGYETRFFRNIELPAEETRILDLELVAAAVLHLRFTDQEGRPVAGSIHFSVSRPGDTGSLGTSLRADPEGRVTYRRLSPGKVALGFKRGRSEWTRLETTIDPGENTLEVVLEMPAAHGAISLQGTIRDANTNEPIPGVTITMPRTRPLRETTTDRQGAYALRSLPPGKHRLYVSKDGYAFHIVTSVETAAGRPTTLDLALRPAATVRLKVFDAKGKPVTGDVFFGMDPIGHDGTDLGTGVDIDPQGVGYYRQILPGRYRLRVGREGAYVTVETEVRPGVNDVEFRLP